MQYFVKRGDQRFGPYSLSDLQHYVQSGNIFPDDLTQSEGMTDWVSVSQVLGDIPAMPISSDRNAEVPAIETELVPSLPISTGLSYSSSTSLLGNFLTRFGLWSKLTGRVSL